MRPLGILLQSPMQVLQNDFYIALVSLLLIVVALVAVLVGARRLVPVWRVGHPVIASLTGTLLLLVTAFILVGTGAVLAAIYHGEHP